MPNITLTDSLIHCANILGEGPLWHPAEQKLYWIDIDLGLIQTLEPITAQRQTFNVGKKLGCYAFRQEGGLILATASGFAFWDAAGGTRQDLVSIYPPDSPLMMNDGRVDLAGRFWAGSKGPHGMASLFRLDPDLRLQQILSGVTISNGIDWSPDGCWCYYTDSGENRLHRFRFDLENGTLSDRQVFFHPGQGTPDGLTVDSAGNIWTALWDGWKVVQLSPEGDLMQEIELPVSRPTAVALGGSDLRTLFITSARADLSPADLAAQPLAGDLFSVRVETPGKPANLFRGVPPEAS